MSVRRRSDRPRPGEVRALAVDVDGTLTDEDRNVGLEAVEALRTVQKAGVHVMLASGNVLPIAFGLSQYLGFIGPVIAENGGIVAYKHDVWRIGDPARPLAAYEFLRTKMDAPRLFTDKWRETEVGLKESVDAAKVKELLGGMGVDVETTGFATHIMTKGMNKVEGVRKACDVLGIGLEQVAAFGDSENDIRMVGECGFGIAVSNADEATKSAASYVAKEAHGLGIVDGLVWLGLILGCSGKTICRVPSVENAP